LSNDKLNLLLQRVLEISATELNDNIGIGGIQTWDSMRHLYLIATIESEFSIELNSSQYDSLRTIGQIRSLLRDIGAY
jgi:acyl carrier protein